MKGKIRGQWGKLTDDDLGRIAGKKDQLIGRIRQALKKGLPTDEAKDYGLWPAKMSLHDDPEVLVSPINGRNPGSVWVTLDGEPQTARRFEHKIIRRMGKRFYRHALPRQYTKRERRANPTWPFAMRFAGIGISNPAPDRLARRPLTTFPLSRDTSISLLDPSPTGHRT